MFVSLKNPIYLHIFIHYSSIISNLCCFFQEQAKYWDVYPANVPSAIISDLEPGVEYSIDVMSINNMGESNFTLDPVIVRTSSKKIMLILVYIVGLKPFWSNISIFQIVLNLFEIGRISPNLVKLVQTCIKLFKIGSPASSWTQSSFEHQVRKSCWFLFLQYILTLQWH